MIRTHRMDAYKRAKERTAPRSLEKREGGEVHVRHVTRVSDWIEKKKRGGDFFVKNRGKEERTKSIPSILCPGDWGEKRKGGKLKKKSVL